MSWQTGLVLTGLWFIAIYAILAMFGRNRRDDDWREFDDQQVRSLRNMDLRRRIEDNGRKQRMGTR